MKRNGGQVYNLEFKIIDLTLMVLAKVAFPALAQRPSLNVYFQSTLEDAAYQKAVFAKASAAWKAPKVLPAVGKKAVVQAIVAKDGKVTSSHVSMSSGSKAWDDAALAAVKSASPYAPLPSGYRYPTLEVHFHVALVP